jgi:hypothetical protein
MTPGFKKDPETGLIETPTGARFTEEEIAYIVEEHKEQGSAHQYGMVDDCLLCHEELNATIGKG